MLVYLQVLGPPLGCFLCFLYTSFVLEERELARYQRVAVEFTQLASCAGLVLCVVFIGLAWNATQPI